MNPNKIQNDAYLNVNKQLWDDKVDYHVTSEFYSNEAFINGQTSLQSIELELLGDITGKRILHLQCHFGQDSLSLARMGAKVVGIDFSEKAISKAKELNLQLGLDVEFHCIDVYNVPKLDLEPFDLVYTSYGVIGWLPDINKWAKMIASQLKTGGKIILVEFHPYIWMYDNDFNDIMYSYFNVSPIIEETEGTYAQTDAPIKNQSINWNHALCEVITAILASNMDLKSFQEFPYSPYNCFSNMENIERNKYVLSRFGDKIPMVYALTATKKG
ncbi:MAG: class I SAM-dependent methyltransferase [Saprospiraceae bacterium]